MARVILFGGGDGGGLLIGASGVRPIPPFDPKLRLQLRSLSALLKVTAALPAEAVRSDLESLTTKLSTTVVDQVEAVIGELDEEQAITYQDDDGGFTCGSTGKPPLPIPWPPLEWPRLDDVLSHGLMDHDLLQLVDEATKKKIDVTTLIKDPEGVAKDLGLSISSRSAADLKLLLPTTDPRVTDPPDPGIVDGVGQEIREYFRQVVTQGQHLERWATQPAEISRALGVKLSPAAIDRLLAGGNSAIPGFGPQANPVAVAVVVAVVVMLVPSPTGSFRFKVKDSSNVPKF